MKFPVVGVFVVSFVLVACSGTTTHRETAAPASEPVQMVAPPIPASSPLAQVKLGMDFKAVRNLIGAPSDEQSYPTGKAFIPFYFGNDARRVSWFYKGMGRVVFAAGNVFGGQGDGQAIRVEYDPAEIGVAR